MTLEQRKNNIIESLKFLSKDCAWFNEYSHIDSAISLLEGVILYSDLYPEDPISQKWKKERDLEIVIEREVFERNLKGE
jgi:hypothetical protein